MSVLGTRSKPPSPGSVPYSIDAEETPVHGRIPVLRVYREPWKERFGLVLSDVSGLEQSQAGSDV